MTEPNRKADYQASLALRHCPGLGPRTWKRILVHFGTAAKAVDHSEEWPGLGLVNKAQWRDFQAGAWLGGAEQEARAVADRGMEMLLWSDPDYPLPLRRIPDPPVFLYVLGDRSLLQSPTLAVVGSRRCSRYGLDAVRKISRDVSRAGICVVSGFAAGIDRHAHIAALEEIGSSIAVLGTGLDLVYPAANKDVWLALRNRGLIVTEFAPGTKPDAVNFPHRNRIISGLALGVLVIEAAVRSGSLITAATALEQGREVFALPGPVDMETYGGCHHLIRQGAVLVQGVEDILNELRPLLDAAGLPRPLRPDDLGRKEPVVPSLQERWSDLNDEDLRVVAFLDGQGRVHIDALCAALDQEPGEMSTRLLLLEMRSLVTQYPGMYYAVHC